MDEILEHLHINPAALSQESLDEYIKAMEVNYIGMIKEFIGHSYNLRFTRVDTENHMEAMKAIVGEGENAKTYDKLPAQERQKYKDHEVAIQENAKEVMSKMMTLDQQIYNLPFYEHMILALKKLRA